MSSSVIHDLGFRHYDGERLGRGWLFRSLLVETLRGVFGLGRPARVKVMPWLLGAFMMGPVVVSVIILFVTGAQDHIFDYRVYPMFLSFILTLFVAARAPYAVSRDLRDGTMPLYLSRPLTYRDYVWAKYAGLTLGTFAIMAVPQTVMLVTALLAKLPASEHIRAWAAGLVFSLVVALILSALGLVIAAHTPRRGLGVAAIAATLIIASAMGMLFADPFGPTGHLEIAPFLGAVDPMLLVNGLAVAWLGSPGMEGVPTAETMADGLVFGGLFLFVVGACLALLMRRYKRVGGA